MIQQLHKMQQSKSSKEILKLRLESAERALVEQWRLLASYCDDYLFDVEVLKEIIWKYIEENDIELYKKCKLYSNISGVHYSSTRTTLAHYTADGELLGSVKDLGNKPIEYERTFRITREMFNINLLKLMFDDLKINDFNCITVLFELKNK